jgi:hypothetical protein
VGQLDFTDFVASAALGQDEVSAGATSLRPPRTWRASVTLEQRFWTDGVISAAVRREWIDDVIDRVAVRQGTRVFDAVGNIGSGWRQTLHLEVTLPFARLGWTGLRLQGSLDLLRSRVTDPETGLRRIISKDRPVEGELRLTDDLPGGRWSWGMDASLAHHERQFRFDQVRLQSKGSSFGAYVEYRPDRDWRIRLEAANLTGRAVRDVRERFDGPRASAPLRLTQDRQIGTEAILILSARRAF